MPIAELLLDEDGHLAAGQDWDEDVAKALAERLHLPLTPPRWQAACALREFIDEHQREPTQRIFASLLGRVWQREDMTSALLREVFPNGALRQAACIAGLPLPTDCLTAQEKLRRNKAPQNR